MSIEIESLLADWEPLPKVVKPTSCRSWYPAGPAQAAVQGRPRNSEVTKRAQARMSQPAGRVAVRDAAAEPMPPPSTEAWNSGMSVCRGPGSVAGSPSATVNHISARRSSVIVGMISRDGRGERERPGLDPITGSKERSWTVPAS